MQIPRFGLVASLGMTKQVGESRFEDCSLRERSFRSVEWRELELHPKEIPVSGDGPQSSRAERTEATPL